MNQIQDISKNNNEKLEIVISVNDSHWGNTDYYGVEEDMINIEEVEGDQVLNIKVN